MSDATLGLRVGETVEVKSREEILATLDASGALDGLPFMPEMAAFCGRRLTVRQRADKTCDTIAHTGLRRMQNTVHLDGTRCSGSAHGGCEAGCELFWKEAWLRRTGSREHGAGSRNGRCTVAMLEAATRQPHGNGGDVHYRCQATELLRASTPLSSWDVRQYARDVRSGNVGAWPLLKSVAWSVMRWVREHVPGYRLQIALFNAIQRLRGGAPFSDLAGDRARTPTESLGLAPGDWVEVKSVEEIRATLDKNQKNRGLYFDVEMTPYCGRRYRVRSLVRRIVDEPTGRLIDLPGSCVILEGGICIGKYHKYCPRAIYSFWREIWLRRVPPPASTS